MPSQASQQQNWPEYQLAPERNPDKYGPVAQNNQKKCERLASDFFKDSVKRARDRNVRWVVSSCSNLQFRSRLLKDANVLFL
jgi:protein-serine/threonine kinase